MTEWIDRPRRPLSRREQERRQEAAMEHFQAEVERTFANIRGEREMTATATAGTRRTKHD